MHEADGSITEGYFEEDVFQDFYDYDSEEDLAHNPDFKKQQTRKS